MGEIEQADLRNGEPGALDNDAGHSRAPDEPAAKAPDDVDRDPDQRLQPDVDMDVTEPTDDGEPVHHNTGGDIGDGAD